MYNLITIHVQQTVLAKNLESLDRRVERKWVIMGLNAMVRQAEVWVVKINYCTWTIPLEISGKELSFRENLQCRPIIDGTTREGVHHKTIK